MSLYIEPGDIILARNARGKNPTPGFWNHAAVVAKIKGTFCAVEVQCDFNEVVAFRLENFLKRYPTLDVYRPRFGDLADKVASFAAQNVGHAIEYCILPKKTSGKNVGRDHCVSFVRKCFENVADLDLQWRVPDDVQRCPLLNEVDMVCNKDWVEPDNRWEGRM